jgi:hypothetical protein
MTRTELIVQLLKVAIGLAFGAYFVWWSLEVLDRLTPQYDVPAAGREGQNWTPMGLHPLGWTGVMPFNWPSAGRVPLQT